MRRYQVIMLAFLFCLCVPAGSALGLNASSLGAVAQVPAVTHPAEFPLSDVRAAIDLSTADPWRVEYYSGKDFGQYFATDYESTEFIYHDWGTSGPGHGLGPDFFSIRYERSVYFPETGCWKFRVRSDDGFRLFVDGRPIGEEWSNGWHDIAPEVDPLSAGNHQVKLEYQQWTGVAKVELRWFRCQSVMPGAPSDLRATARSRTQIDLVWSDHSMDESDFHVERSPDGSTGWAEIATVIPPSYNDTGLDCASRLSESPQRRRLIHNL